MPLSEADRAIYRHVGHLTVPGVLDEATTQALVADVEQWGEQFLRDLPPQQRAWYVDGGVTARSVLRKLDNPHHHREAFRRLASHPNPARRIELEVYME